MVCSTTVFMLRLSFAHPRCFFDTYSFVKYSPQVGLYAIMRPWDEKAIRRKLKVSTTFWNEDPFYNINSTQERLQFCHELGSFKLSNRDVLHLRVGFLQTLKVVSRWFQLLSQTSIPF